MDFQIAELESILDMYGIALGGPDCQILPLPNASPHQSLALYRHERPFVILSLPGHQAAVLSNNDNTIEKWGVNSARAKKSSGIGEILNRCTLVRSVIELWGYGTSMEEAAIASQTWAKDSKMGKSIYTQVADSSQSWKMTVHTLGTKYTREEQDSMRKHFSNLGFMGPVIMEQFHNEFIVIREVEMDGNGSPKYPRHVKKQLIPENDARSPLGVYFGRVVGGLRRGRNGLDNYNLRNRVFLGPTSMDAELSFVMASYGQVQIGSMVYDPFVGTGSILLSCALRGLAVQDPTST